MEKRVTPKDEQWSVMLTAAAGHNRLHHKFPAPQQDHQQRRWIYFLAADFLTFEQCFCRIVKLDRVGLVAIVARSIRKRLLTHTHTQAGGRKRRNHVSLIASLDLNACRRKGGSSHRCILFLSFHLKKHLILLIHDSCQRIYNCFLLQITSDAPESHESGNCNNKTTTRESAADRRRST